MTKTQILKELEGNEIWSIQFENLVTVKDGKIIRYINDKRQIINPTKAQAHELFEEAFEAEFGTRNVMALCQEEFGNQ